MEVSVRQVALEMAVAGATANNDNSGIEPVNELAGFQGSHWENRIFQEVFNSPGVSTTNGARYSGSSSISAFGSTRPSAMNRSNSV